MEEDDGISCEDQNITTQWREHFAIVKLINITTTINTITSLGLKGNEMFEDVSIITKRVHVC
jgi:selenocysteine-specific translation elongation factor